MKKKIYCEAKIVGFVLIFLLVFVSCKERERIVYSGMEKESQNYRFSEFIKNIRSFPYEIRLERRKKLIQDYSKLSIGADKEKVKKLLGPPDAEFLSYDTTKGKIYVGSSWGYYLHRHEAVRANEHFDQAIFLYFDPNEKLYWVHSDNVDTLRDMGSPDLRK